MYLGGADGGVVDLAVEEVQRAVRRMLAELGVDLPAFHGSRIGFMLPEAGGRQAVALVGEAWGMYQIRDDLQAALGDLIAPDVRRFQEWRPHVTLGYVADYRAVTTAQRERIGGIMYRRDYEDVVLPIAQIAVSHADLALPIGQRRFAGQGETGDVPPGIEEPPNYAPTDEPRSARDQNSAHAVAFAASRSAASTRRTIGSNASSGIAG
jgi:hypothetical protein